MIATWGSVVTSTPEMDGPAPDRPGGPSVERRRIGRDGTVHRLMTATSTSATYRTSAVRPGPIRLVVEAIRESWSRRRLIGYLVQADLKKKGADTVLGNVWWILDPLLQM